MKTAEEWVIDYMKMIGVNQSVIDNPFPEDVEHRNQRVKFFKQIQLDAAKWGAEQAAMQNDPKSWPDKPEQCAVRSCNVKILTFAANLTNDQLPNTKIQP